MNFDCSDAISIDGYFVNIYSMFDCNYLFVEHAFHSNTTKNHSTDQNHFLCKLALNNLELQVYVCMRAYKTKRTKSIGFAVAGQAFIDVY